MIKKITCCLFILCVFTESVFAINTGNLIAYPVPFNPKKQVLSIADKNNPLSNTLDGVTPNSVKIDIYDINGDRVLSKNLSSLPVKWNGRNSRGIRVKPGMYIIKIVVEDTVNATYGKKIIRILVNY